MWNLSERFGLDDGGDQARQWAQWRRQNPGRAAEMFGDPDEQRGPRCDRHDPAGLQARQENARAQRIKEQLAKPRTLPPKQWNHEVPADHPSWTLHASEHEHVTDIKDRGGSQRSWRASPCPLDDMCPQCIAAADELEALGEPEPDVSRPSGLGCWECEAETTKAIEKARGPVAVSACSVLVPGPAGSHMAWATATQFSDDTMTLAVERLKPGHRGAKAAKRLAKLVKSQPAPHLEIYIDTRDAAGAEVTEYREAAQGGRHRQPEGPRVVAYCVNYGPGSNYKPGVPDAIYALGEVFDEDNPEAAPAIQGDGSTKKYFKAELAEYQSGQRGVIDPETGDRHDSLVLAAGIAVHVLTKRISAKIVTPPIGQNIDGSRPSLAPWEISISRW